jgi:hypothetical protein
MGFTKGGQINPRLLSERDRRFNISTAEKKKNRKDIPLPKVDPTANAWERNIIKQFILSDAADSAAHKHQGPIQTP